MGRRDAVVDERLAAHRFITQNAKADAIPFGIEAPILESQGREHPAAATCAGNTYDFALQIRWRFYFRRRHDVADQLVDQTGDEHKIRPFSGRAEHRACGGAFVELGVAAGQRGHADWTIAYMDKRQVQTITSEDTLVLGDVHGGLALAKRAGGHNDLS